ncbi:hypothetical protein GGS21DRAFT_15818 [Xylaria nigripes]|nr:hypothetical protein GGS21DRAFT_15818 [Xylaria nigripes]
MSLLSAFALCIAASIIRPASRSLTCPSPPSLSPSPPDPATRLGRGRVIFFFPRGGSKPVKCRMIHWQQTKKYTTRARRSERHNLVKRPANVWCYSDKPPAMGFLPMTLYQEYRCQNCASSSAIFYSARRVAKLLDVLASCI